LKIVGCDYNTKGEFWASTDDGELRAIYEYRFPPLKDYADRLSAEPKTILHWVRDDIDPITVKRVLEGEADWYGIEGYVSFHDREGKMAGMHWTIRARMNRLANPLILPPARWKKEIGLSGNANKDAIKAHIQNLYPDLPKNLPQDAYDAVGIVRAAHRIISYEQRESPPLALD
jgi:hypothetical protein